MQIEKVTDFPLRLAEDLRCIYSEMPEAERSVFNDPFFLLSCWRSRADGVDQFGLLGWEDSKLLGAAFFRYEFANLAGRKKRCIVPLGNGLSEFTPFLALPSAKRQLLQAMLRELSASAHSILLSNLREQDYGIVQWQDASAPGAKWVLYGETLNPVSLDEQLSFEKILSKKSLTAATKGISGSGNLEITHRTSNIPQATLTQLMELHAERWAFEGKKSKFEDSSVANLYRSVCREYPTKAAEGNFIVVSAASLDDEPIAMHLGFRWGDTFLYQVPVMNLAFMERSPGQLLLRALYEYACNEGLETFDLGRGDEPYKKRFASNVLHYRTYALLTSPYDKFRFSVRSALRRALNGQRANLALTLRSAMRWFRRKAAFRRVILFSRHPDAEKPETIREGDGSVIELRFADAVRQSRQNPEFPYAINRKLYDRFRQGYRLFALQKDRVLVSFAWAVQKSEQWIGEVDQTAKASCEALWIIDCVTPGKHRGQGFYPDLLRKIATRHNVERVFIYCLAGNEASRRGIVKAGFQPLGTIVHFFGLARLSRVLLEDCSLSLKRSSAS